MRKIYESPEAEIVTFAAMEQLALLPERNGNMDPGDGPTMSGEVGDREDW